MKALKVLFALGLTFILVACGIFSKTKRAEKTRVKKQKTEIVAEQKGITIQQQHLDTEFTELIIRMPTKKDHVEGFDSLVYGYETLQDAIVDAIRHSESTTVRHQTVRSGASQEVDTTKTEKSTRETLDNLKSKSDLDKQSDTTWLANFNPWVILGIAAMIIFAFFMYFKLKRP